MPDNSNLKPLPDSNKRLLISLHIGFLLIGIITVLLGQILPILSRRLSLNDGESGYFFIAQFAGSLTGVFFYNQGIKKIGHLKTLLIGFCLMSVGCFGLNTDNFIWCLLTVLLYGIGIGITIPTINMLVVELNPVKSSSLLNLINFFWGIGAILCKPFVDYVGSPETYFLPTVFLAILLLIFGLIIGFSKISESLAEPEIKIVLITPIWKTPTAWLIAFFNFIHIGIESSVGGWITTFENRLPESSPFVWLSAAFVFFLFLVIGRGIAPVFFKYLNENSLLFANLVLMTFGAGVIFLANSFWFLLLGVAILGFGTSSVFPTNMSRFTKIFGAESARNATPIFILGSLGGAFMTWLVGFISTSFGNLRIGFLVVLTGCAVLLIFQIIISQTGKFPQRKVKHEILK